MEIGSKVAKERNLILLGNPSGGKGDEKRNQRVKGRGVGRQLQIAWGRSGAGVRVTSTRSNWREHVPAVKNWQTETAEKREEVVKMQRSGCLRQ